MSKQYVLWLGDVRLSYSQSYLQPDGKPGPRYTAHVFDTLKEALEHKQVYCVWPYGEVVPL